MTDKPTTDEIFTTSARPRVPLDEVKRHPHGAIFADPAIVVRRSGDRGAARRRQRGDAGRARRGGARGRAAAGFARRGAAFRLVSRRMPNVYNSSGRDIAALTRGQLQPRVPAPRRSRGRGLAPGDTVRIASDHASILGVAEAAPELRRGVLSMSHAFGDAPKRDGEFRAIGSTTGRLVD